MNACSSLRSLLCLLERNTALQGKIQGNLGDFDAQNDVSVLKLQFCFKGYIPRIPSVFRYRAYPLNHFAYPWGCAYPSLGIEGVVKGLDMNPGKDKGRGGGGRKFMSHTCSPMTFVCVCLCLYVCVCVCVFTCACVCVCLHMCVCMSLCMCVCLCVCVCLSLYMYVCVCVCVRMCVCVCVRVCVCVCVLGQCC